MSEKIKIEEINKENFNDFFYLLNKLALYEKQENLDKKIKNRIKKDCLSDKPIINIYLTKLKNKYIGYIIFYYTYSSYLGLPTLHIEDLFVEEAYRRRGIGQKMFEFCAKQALDKECGRMEWCVFDWNEKAINFYKKNNAKILQKKYFRLTKQDLENILEGY